jgi:hypothetical protein
MTIDQETNPTGYPFWWNYILAAFGAFKIQECTWYGMWGLLFYNDGGEMMEACLQIGLTGTKADFLPYPAK